MGVDSLDWGRSRQLCKGLQAGCKRHPPGLAISASPMTSSSRRCCGSTSRASASLEGGGISRRQHESVSTCALRRHGCASSTATVKGACQRAVSRQKGRGYKPPAHPAGQSADVSTHLIAKQAASNMSTPGRKEPNRTGRPPNSSARWGWECRMRSLDGVAGRVGRTGQRRAAGRKEQERRVGQQQTGLQGGAGEAARLPAHTTTLHKAQALAHPHT